MSLKSSHRSLLRASIKNPFLAQATSEWNKKKLSSFNIENSKATLVVFWVPTKTCQTCVKLLFIFLFIKLSRVFSLWEAKPTNHQAQLTCYWLDKQIISHLYCYALCEFIFCSGTSLHRFWADNCSRCFYFVDFQTMIWCEGGALVSLKTIQIYSATIPHDLFRDQIKW